MRPHRKFVDRRGELAALDDFLRHPPSAARHRALIAPRRMGKTELIGEFRRTHPKAVLPYVDVESAWSNPYNFALRTLAAVVAELAGERDAAPRTPAEVAVLGARLPRSLVERIEPLVTRAGSGAEPDATLRGTLLLADELVVGAKTRGVLFFDECQGWFAGPEEPATRIEPVLREVADRLRALRLVFSGSAARVMEATFREAIREEHPPRPLHGRVAIIRLGPFSREDTAKLVDLVWRGARADEAARQRVYVLTRGHPAGADHLAERAASDARLARRAIDVDAVSRAFVAELFESGGYLNAIVEGEFRSATAQRTGTSLERIVRAIAELGPERATQAAIANLSGIAAPNVSAAMPRLLNVDLLRYDEDRRTYALADPMLSIWLRGRDKWTPGGRSTIPPRLVEILQEELLRLQQDSGTSFEARVRDVAAHFDGRLVSGALFGAAGQLRLPTVDRAVRRITAVDTTGALFPRGTPVELDVHIQGQEVWLGEVKHTGRAASAKAVQGLLDKVRFYGEVRGMAVARRWFVSAGGFEQKAEELAKKEGVLLTTKRQLQSLERALAKPARPTRRGR